MNVRKTSLLSIIFFLCSYTSAFAAYRMNAVKVFTGDQGGVITVQKQAAGERNTFRDMQGQATVSDVHTEFELPSNTDSLLVLLSGRVNFAGERVFQEFGHLVMNGTFRVLKPENHRLVLENITVVGIEGSFTISGTITIDDVAYDFADAPDTAQRFIYRLLWWIRQ